MIDLQYLITGTGRCGTVFYSRVLTSLGIACGHEAIFDWQGGDVAASRVRGETSIEHSFCSVSKFIPESGCWVPETGWTVPTSVVADSSYLAAPFLDRDFLKDTKKIHLVRHPQKVIDSMVTSLDYFKSDVPSNNYELLIYRTLPELQRKMSAWERCALYYVLWNEMIQRGPIDLFVKIEDGTDKLLSFLGKTGPHYNDQKTNTLGTSKKKFRMSLIQSKEIAQRFESLSNLFGYELPKEIMFL